ncbi:hypothetical protein G7077_09750 [Sphingomonas piscis]|uniref:Uncharacterized protein n=1 Tax=Sphingomonas piscis TaxID=2714943 RepID=A0A6G7YQW2_9SPHN|nr:hypothetical protein [Sphingomonas piscis]QIK79138.1 hypothetical protein G7077_09750 [Sphingomonas piscis]
MEYDDVESSARTRWKDKPLLLAVLLLLLLASPLGAPLVGMSIISGCDIPWEGSYQCAVPQRLQDYFIGLMMLSFLSIGLGVGLLWLGLAVGLTAYVGYLLVVGVWNTFAGRFATGLVSQDV